MSVLLVVNALNRIDHGVGGELFGDGGFAFIELRPGTYAIEETQPAGFDDGLESLGEVTDLGVDVKPEVFIESVQRIQPQIVALSALLTTTMPNMKLSIDAMRDAGILRQVKVMVGGAPITTEFAQQLGADGFAPDASRAAALARTFVA